MDTDRRLRFPFVTSCVRCRFPHIRLRSNTTPPTAKTITMARGVRLGPSASSWPRASLSSEMAGRILRFSFFHSVCRCWWRSFGRSALSLADEVVGRDLWSLWGGSDVAQTRGTFFKKIGYFAGWGACDGGLFHLDRWIGRLRREFSMLFTDCGCGFVTWGTWLDGLWSLGMLRTEAFLPSRLYGASRCPPAVAM